jgi:hypothetical protein
MREEKTIRKPATSIYSFTTPSNSITSTAFQEKK